MSLSVNSRPPLSDCQISERIGKAINNFNQQGYVTDDINNVTSSLPKPEVSKLQKKGFLTRVASAIKNNKGKSAIVAIGTMALGALAAFKYVQAKEEATDVKSDNTKQTVELQG